MHRSLLTTRIPGRLAAGHTAVFVHGWPDNSNVFAPLTGHDSPLLDRFASLLLCDLPLCDRRSWNPELLDFETLAALLASSEFFSVLVPLRNLSLPSMRNCKVHRTVGVLKSLERH